MSRKYIYSSAIWSLEFLFAIAIFCQSNSVAQFNWSVLKVPNRLSSDNFIQISAANDKCIAIAATASLGSFPCILDSKDCGLSWNWIYRDTLTFGKILEVSSSRNRFSHPSASTYLYLCDKNEVLSSHDSGATWNLIQFSKGDALNYAELFMSDSANGYIVSGVRNIFRTWDGGRSWNRIESPKQYTEYYMLSTHVFDSATMRCTIFSMTSGGDIDSMWSLNTRDAGLTWSRMSLPSYLPKDYSSLFYLDELHGWMLQNVASGVGSRKIHKIFRTVDGGASWDVTFEGELADVDNSPWSLREIRFYDRLNGVAIGSEKIALTSDGGENWKLQHYSVPMDYARFFINCEYLHDKVLLVIGSDAEILLGNSIELSIMDELSSESDIYLFPNPSIEVVYVRSKKPLNNVSVFIFNCLGLCCGYYKADSFGVKNLSSGAYYCLIQCETKSAVIPLIVTH